MAPTAGSITVNWTSNYAGQHRVCWRIGSSGPYDCSTLVNCTGGGSPCSVVIPVTVDNETCSTLTFEGYVQSGCEDVTSTNGRIPFSTTFVPSPTCLPITVTCSNVSLAGFEITNPGSGYVVAPGVTITGGGGSAAAGTAVVGTGGITGLIITNPGSGGPVGPVTYSGVASVAISTSGTGTFDVDVTGGVISGVTVVTSTGFVAGDTFTFNSASIGSTTGTVITVTTEDTGTITQITLTNPGSGYTSQPSVTLSAGTATAEAILAPCAGAWLSGNNCLGNAYSAYPIGVELGQAFDLCNTGAVDPGTIPSEFTITPSVDCCYDCVDIQITYNNPGGDPVDYAYINCNSLDISYRDFVSDTINDGDTVTISCVVNNSWAFSSTTGITVVSSASSC